MIRGQHMRRHQRSHSTEQHWPPPMLHALRSGRLRVACSPAPLKGLSFALLRRQLDKLSSVQRKALDSAWAMNVATAPRVSAVLDLQGLEAAVAEAHQRKLPRYHEAVLLEATVRDRYGRRHWLQPVACQALTRMRDAARADGVQLEVISSFRSIRDQCRILRRKLRQGLDWSLILRVSAPPGHSEHHTGCAVDLATPGQSPLIEAFEHTPAFAWMCRHASRFGFRMSYPRNNPWGFVYEPWHWCFGPQQLN